VRHLVVTLITLIAVIILVIVLAHELRPYLPFLFGLLLFGWIIRLFIRS
jgi:hypothetical protein